MVRLPLFLSAAVLFTIFLTNFQGIYGATTGELIDYRLALLKTITAVDPPRNCTHTGNQCNTCTKLMQCIKDGDKWIQTIVPCPAGEYCSESLPGQAQCSKDKNPLCDGTAAVPFQCSGHVTMFPDQFYCDKFHVCASSVCKSANTCPSGWNYNMKTTYCDKPISESEIGCDPFAMKFPVPICESLLQTGPLPENDSLYYVCMNQGVYLYPFLHVCPNGEQFVDYECKPREGPATTEDPATEEPTTEELVTDELP